MSRVIVFGIMFVLVSGAVCSGADYDNVINELYTGTRDDFTGRVGFSFRAEQDFSINALGRAVNPDYNGGVLQTSHIIELFEISTATLLATATVDGTCQKDSLGYAFKSLAVPVNIISGQEYVIFSNETAGSGDRWRDLSAMSNYQTDYISILGGEFYSYGVGHPMPPLGQQGGPEGAYVPPAFSIDTVVSTGPVENNLFNELYTGDRNDFTGRLGFSFQADQTFQISALGRPVNPYYNEGLLLQNHVIELWDVFSSTLVASVTVGPGSEKDSLGYAFDTMASPVILYAGQQYVILSSETIGDGDLWRDLFGVPNYQTGYISIMGGEYNYGSPGDAIAAPGKLAGFNAAYVSPTFIIWDIDMVDAGEDQDAWLTDGTVDVTLAGSLNDDGIPVPATVLWSVVSEPDPASNPAAFTPDPPNPLGSVVSLSAAGTYVLLVQADDTVNLDLDTMVINVYTDACKHAQDQAGFKWKVGDMNQDCNVNVADLAQWAGVWLTSTID